MSVNLGGDLYGPPDDAYVALAGADASAASDDGASGVVMFIKNTAPSYAGGYITTAGALVAYFDGGAGAAAGQAKIYALTYTP